MNIDLLHNLVQKGKKQEKHMWTMGLITYPFMGKSNKIRIKGTRKNYSLCSFFFQKKKKFYAVSFWSQKTT